MKNKLSIEVKITDDITFKMIPVRIKLAILLTVKLLQELMNAGKIPKKNILDMTLNEILDTV